jgi:hypothetical protein
MLAMGDGGVVILSYGSRWVEAQIYSKGMSDEKEQTVFEKRL